MSLLTSLSPLELRRILESAFLPDHCVCSISEKQQLAVTISDVGTGAIKLAVRGIAAERVANSRGISQLVAELRMELREQGLVQRAAL